MLPGGNTLTLKTSPPSPRSLSYMSLAWIVNCAAVPAVATARPAPAAVDLVPLATLGVTMKEKGDFLACVS